MLTWREDGAAPNTRTLRAEIESYRVRCRRLEDEVARLRGELLRLKVAAHAAAKIPAAPGRRTR
jgi:hypothetical protein